MRSRPTVAVMGLAALTLAAASFLHLGPTFELGPLTIRGELFVSAAVPEAIIAVVMLAGAISFAIRPDRRAWAAAATVFAIIGVIVGVTAVVRGHHPAADLLYHTALLLLLLLIAGLLIRPPAQVQSAAS